MHHNSHEGQNIKDLVLRVLNEKDQWSKHLAHSCCKCEKCTCGKHKCKLTSFKLNLQPSNSTYHQSYQKRDPLEGKNSRIKAPNNQFHPNQLVQKSEYREQYYRKKNKGNNKQKAKAKPNNLEIGGPSFNSTTYDQDYPPKSSPPPKQIKNPENLCNSRMKMNTTSNYASTYKWNDRKPKPREQPIIQSNNLKTEPHQHFMGCSTYNHDFNVLVKGKRVQKESFAPDRRYESSKGLRAKSSYQSDYTQKRPDVCPAAFCC